MTTYPAKLLLFGEHTVNVGSRALALPLPLFSGKWAYPDLGSPSALAVRQQQLPQFADYLGGLQQRGALLAHLDVAAFKRALGEGLVFESNIPVGYGAGSSGAVVAAVLGKFGIENWPLEGTPIVDLKKALAQMEAFFHGTSSGTDPLVCFMQCPVLLGGQHGEVHRVEVPKKFYWATDNRLPKKNSHQIFLLDTGKPRDAAVFIDYFLDKMKGYTFQSRVQISLNPDVDTAIDAFLRGDGKRLFEQLGLIGRFQQRFLPRLIPTKLRPAWQQGLAGDLFRLKVCGAGGGGFVLGITRDFEAAKVAFAGHRLLPVFGLAG